jgi:arylsulfatase A-like enzyme
VSRHLTSTPDRRRGLPWLSTCLVAAAVGCSPAPPSHVAFRLVELLPGATFRSETTRLDLADPSARPFLLAGFEAPPALGAPRDWLWSSAAASSVELRIAVPRPLRAEVSCRLADRFADDGLAVEVFLNERRVGLLQLERGRRKYGVDLPAAAQRAGSNRLTFVYTPAKKARLRDRRAVGWLEIRLAGAPGGGRTTAQTSEEIRLADGAEVSFALEAPAGAELSLAGLSREGGAAGGEGELRVTVEGEEGEPSETLLRPGDACCAAVPLAEDAARLVRITFRAGPGPQGNPGGLRLREPRVMAPEPAATLADGDGAEDAGAPEQGAPGRAAPGRAAPAPVGNQAGRSAAATQRRPPDVVLYLVDTLRADRLGVYGHPGGLTPNLDAFAREATVYDNATAQAPWTKPSMASIFTGLDPLDHGVWTFRSVLTDGAVTLAERFAAAGYRTAGVSTNGNVSATFGFAQGFHDFALLEIDIDSRTVNRQVLQWLDASDPAQPQFLYVHTMEPHQPYSPPADMRARFAADVPAGLVGERTALERAHQASGAERAELVRQLFRLYDADVAHNDRSFGELMAELRRRGRYDDALVVVVADHGEEFDEHGFLQHMKNLHAETIDIPLIVKRPRQRKGERVHDVVQHIDLLPTLLGAAGISPPGGLRGRGLRAPRAGGAAPRLVFSHLANRRQGMSLRRAEWKLLDPLGQPGETLRLYRRRGAGDGAERRDLARDEPLRAEYLRSLLALEIARPRSLLLNAETDLDAPTREALRALGYL